MGSPEVEAFLTYLAVHEHVSASTQNQCLQALLFLYRRVLEIELPHGAGIAGARGRAGDDDLHPRPGKRRHGREKPFGSTALAYSADPAPSAISRFALCRYTVAHLGFFPLIPASYRVQVRIVRYAVL
jgi:hypothetical protein